MASVNSAPPDSASGTAVAAPRPAYISVDAPSATPIMHKVNSETNLAVQLLTALRSAPSASSVRSRRASASRSSDKPSRSLVSDGGARSEETTDGTVGEEDEDEDEDEGYYGEENDEQVDEDEDNANVSENDGNDDSSTEQPDVMETGDNDTAHTVHHRKRSKGVRNSYGSSGDTPEKSAGVQGRRKLSTSRTTSGRNLSRTMTSISKGKRLSTRDRTSRRGSWSKSEGTKRQSTDENLTNGECTDEDVDSATQHQSMGPNSARHRTAPTSHGASSRDIAQSSPVTSSSDHLGSRSADGAASPKSRDTRPRHASTSAAASIGTSSVRAAHGTVSPGDTTLYKYSREERLEALRRFKEKKRLRTFKKTIRYDVRKRLADTRPRYKGRFSKPPAGETYDDGTPGPLS